MLVAVLQNHPKENKNSRFEPNSINTIFPSQMQAYQIEGKDGKNDSHN